MDPIPKKELRNDVPAEAVRFVFVAAFLIFAPIILFLALPNVNDHPLMLKGKTIIFYYFALAILAMVLMWKRRKDFAVIESRIETKINKRPVLRFVYLAGDLVSGIVAIATVALILYAVFGG